MAVVGAVLGVGDTGVPGCTENSARHQTKICIITSILMRKHTVRKRTKARKCSQGQTNSRTQTATFFLMLAFCDDPATYVILRVNQGVRYLHEMRFKR
jgi:hypothetical protein